jgi:hypothetical protein
MPNTLEIPSITSLIQDSAGGGGSPGGAGSHMPFMAGIGFTRFADTIKKLSGLAGGPTTPGATASRPAPPAMGAPAPHADPPGIEEYIQHQNPLLQLGRVLSLMKSATSSPDPLQIRRAPVDILRQLLGQPQGEQPAWTPPDTGDPPDFSKLSDEQLKQWMDSTPVFHSILGLGLR